MEQEFLVQHTYLNLPATEHGPKCEVTFSIDGEVVHRFRVRLALDAPDHWVAADLTRFRGKRLRVDVTGYRGGDALSRMTLSDRREGHERIYHEELRPRFHFSAICGWLNDPNGLMYYNGTWFLFAQLNPYFRWCDNMHWLMATSTDLFRWEDKGLVLHADHISQKWSGSGVVDEDNVTGFKDGEDDPLLLFYTDAGSTFNQNLAYSTDGGKTWRDYEKNPVLPQIAPGNRDPKVIRRPDGKGWWMALYLSGYDYALFASDDLLHWEQTCVLNIPGCLECPDIYEIALDGDPSNPKMVFSCAGGQYLVGHMEDNRFIAETELQRCYGGGDVYAPQSFFGAKDGRRIQVICSSNEAMLPGEGFGKFITLPCELTLRTVPGGMKLFSVPACELRGLERAVVREPETLEVSGRAELPAPSSGLYRAELALPAAYKGELKIRVYNLTLLYRGEDHSVEYQGKRYAVCPQGERIAFDLVVDRCSAELFVNEGEIYIPAVMPFDMEYAPLLLEASEPLNVNRLRIAELSSLLPWSAV